MLSFLERVRDAENTPALFDQLRQERPKASRKKIRSFVQTDLTPTSFASLPNRVNLSPGNLHVAFQTVDELAESLMRIAQLLGEDAERFAENYEPKKPPRIEEPNELQAMFAELEAMEAQQAKQQKADL